MASPAGAAIVSDPTGPARPRSRIDRITRALVQLDEQGTAPDFISQTPGEFLREFYKAWLENGGLDGGKNRNSLRRMREEWLIGPREVKSLHPKLTGKVRISKEDARALIDLFLSRWRYGATEDDWVRAADGYLPFPCENCAELRDRLIEALFPDGSQQAAIGLLLPTPTDNALVDDARIAWGEVARLYCESDAVVILSRHKSTLGSTPVETIRTFWTWINYLHEDVGDKDIVLIWVIDIGSRTAEDDDAWAEFFNFELLKAQFHAFATFDCLEDEADDVTSHREHAQGQVDSRNLLSEAFLRSLRIPEEGRRVRRWRWLCERAVIVVQNLRQEEFGNLYLEEDRLVDRVRIRDIGVTAEHILPRTLPHRWGRLRELRELYGNRIDNIADATITVFLRRSGWNLEPRITNRPTDLCYYAHALVPEEARAVGAGLADTARSRQLESPGYEYDEAMRILYWAARHRLNRNTESREASEDLAIAAAYLKRIRFQLLRLPEFLRIHRLPGE